MKQRIIRPFLFLWFGFWHILFLPWYYVQRKWFWKHEVKTCKHFWFGALMNGKPVKACTKCDAFFVISRKEFRKLFNETPARFYARAKAAGKEIDLAKVGQ